MVRLLLAIMGQLVTVEMVRLLLVIMDPIGNSSNILRCLNYYIMSYGLPIHKKYIIVDV